MPPLPPLFLPPPPPPLHDMGSSVGGREEGKTAKVPLTSLFAEPNLTKPGPTLTIRSIPTYLLVCSVQCTCCASLLSVFPFKSHFSARLKRLSSLSHTHSSRNLFTVEFSQFSSSFWQAKPFLPSSSPSRLEGTFDMTDCCSSVGGEREARSIGRNQRGIGGEGENTSRTFSGLLLQPFALVFLRHENRQLESQD